ncbi:MAG: carbamoyltransferase [Gammaproteobacteria bacterium]|jgi:carbamoyltransferase
MKVLGISPLDKDATISIVEDGQVLFAAGEERFSREKAHRGFPHKALAAGLAYTNIQANEIDEVSYAFLTPDQESNLMRKSARRTTAAGDWRAALTTARRTQPERPTTLAGLEVSNERIHKGPLKNFAYWLLGAAPITSDWTSNYLARKWATTASAEHYQLQQELEISLASLGLESKLKRYEHHVSHAANAFLVSGFDRALIMTLDGYGTGLAGSVSIGEGREIKRLQNLQFPFSLGSFYERVTSALGYKPDRHAGKIVGLAAYGDPKIMSDVLMQRIKHTGAEFEIEQNLNYFFDQYLASQFTMIDMAAAYQHVLEVVVQQLVEYWAEKTGLSTIVLSGGVTANVKMNQRIHEAKGIESIFVYPNMGDGGCGTGLALLASQGEHERVALDNAYHGPDFTEQEIEAALKAHNVSYERPSHLAARVAELINNGKVVARFDGRMEYGPRALGNRSILYHAKNPEVNQWLNHRLGRTEFMPFAPVTLWEDRFECYLNLAGAEHTAQFMTITFDCTDWMRENCPAAVHVDGTARPQLVRREVNAGYYDILSEYKKLSGSPTLINTSFNMHEEPIVCTPADAVRAFLDGRLDCLAIGPFVAEQDVD